MLRREYEAISSQCVRCLMCMLGHDTMDPWCLCCVRCVCLVSLTCVAWLCCCACAVCTDLLFVYVVDLVYISRRAFCHADTSSSCHTSDERQNELS